ncbi:poly [ADP-ribose] polymerase 7/11/12/13 [Mytilus galloprovincialis]|uniref:Poly [ADP-ribose] polymerase 7/11/12/13 n=1 Tax=Mytilus galloprovincialis TaxID=29158 RepID=A0A8B6D479_MYTGA|nr:poly [ADP-ribose] polymerase 7/11/12/13 [Mytilus galloprovincialis]
MANLRELSTKPDRNLKRFDLQIVKNAIHQLCTEGNDSLTIEELKEKVEESLGRKFRFSFLPLLQKFDSNFCVENRYGSLLIKAKTTLELCPSHSGIRRKCDKNCNKLHICKFYLLSNSCTVKGNKCRFGHNLKSDYNRILLEYHDLEELDVEELRILFKRPNNRCQVTRPPICKFYNLENGCSKEVGCKFLHICKPYVTGSCRFGRRCRQNHNIFQPQLKELLVKYGINIAQSARGIVEDLKECFTDDSDDDYSDSDDEAPVPVTRSKSRNRGMTRSKSNPSLFTGISSLSLACSCDIDEPRVLQAESNEICIYYLRGNCRYGARCNMQHKGSMYQWQFKDTRGEWTDYRPASNVEIEQKYCDVYNVDCSIQFGKQMRMNIDFIQMTGKKKGTIINVRRLSTESSAVQKFQPLATEYKWYWEDQRERWIVYGGQVECQKTGPEIFTIRKMFFETMPTSCNITSVKRIENGELWMNYVSKREKMNKKKTFGGNVMELQLFHGTNEDIVDAICRQGFDFRFSGSKIGHKYGKGSYFAKMAQTADSYTDFGRKKRMFVVRVLAGEYTLGETSYVRPPPRNPSDPFELFDSCVDNVRNPNIFVIFTFDQVYPEYVIEYQQSNLKYNEF